MTLIDQIKADREAGTPGRIDAVKQFTLNITRCGWNALVWSKRSHIRADARRIERIPDMESALLAAAELAEVVESNGLVHEIDDALEKFRKAIGETQ